MQCPVVWCYRPREVLAMSGTEIAYPATSSCRKSARSEHSERVTCLAKSMTKPPFLVQSVREPRSFAFDFAALWT
eukprot:2068267-Rhodomonas_salina.1